MISTNLARMLQETTGLPITQIASSLGVSRQAYYIWLKGGPISPKYRKLMDTMIECCQREMRTNMAVESKTTPISEDPFHPLEVEFMHYRYAYKTLPDGTSKPYQKIAVSLVHPGNVLFSRSRIVNMSPRTALNLLQWLEQDDVREILQQLVKEEER